VLPLGRRLRALHLAGAARASASFVRVSASRSSAAASTRTAPAASPPRTRGAALATSDRAASADVGSSKHGRSTGTAHARSGTHAGASLRASTQHVRQSLCATARLALLSDELLSTAAAAQKMPSLKAVANFSVEFLWILTPAENGSSTDVNVYVRVVFHTSAWAIGGVIRQQSVSQSVSSYAKLKAKLEERFPVQARRSTSRTRPPYTSAWVCTVDAAVTARAGARAARGESLARCSAGPDGLSPHRLATRAWRAIG
jgi:hypothetical protein